MTIPDRVPSASPTFEPYPRPDRDSVLEQLGYKPGVLAAVQTNSPVPARRDSPAEPAPDTDPADSFLEMLRRVEFVSIDGPDDLNVDRMQVLRYEGLHTLVFRGTSATVDRYHQQRRRRSRWGLAVALGSGALAATCALPGWATLALFLCATFLLLVLHADSLPKLNAPRPELEVTYRVPRGATNDQTVAFSRQLLAASKGHSDVLISALRILKGKHAENANPEVRERTLLAIRDLYRKQKEKQLRVDRPQDIEELTAVATLEARIEMLD